MYHGHHLCDSYIFFQKSKEIVWVFIIENLTSTTYISLRLVTRLASTSQPNHLGTWKEEAARLYHPYQCTVTCTLVLMVLESLKTPELF